MDVHNANVEAAATSRDIWEVESTDSVQLAAIQLLQLSGINIPPEVPSNLSVSRINNYVLKVVS